MNAIITNVLKSISVYFVISVLGFLSYCAIFPDTWFYNNITDRIPIVGIIIAIAPIFISIFGYRLIGKKMKATKNKLTDLLSLSIPAIISSTFLTLGFISEKLFNKLILIILLSNMSFGMPACYFLEWLRPCSYIFAVLPTLIMFLSQQRKLRRKQ